MVLLEVQSNSLMEKAELRLSRGKWSSEIVDHQLSGLVKLLHIPPPPVCVCVCVSEWYQVCPTLTVLSGFLPSSEVKYWTYDDEGSVSFKDVSLPANLSPENMVKVKISHTHTTASCFITGTTDHFWDCAVFAGRKHRVSINVHSWGRWFELRQ